RRAGGFPMRSTRRCSAGCYSLWPSKAWSRASGSASMPPMEANAALRTIVRRDDGRTYREMLTQMAKESGIDTPTAADRVRIDRNRRGKKLSNGEWTSKTDPEAKIAKLKDGRTHLAYKPEHAVDLDTGIIVEAALHPAE